MKLPQQTIILEISLSVPDRFKHGLVWLQTLGWRCVECAIHHERNVCEELHPHIVHTWREQARI